MIALALSVALVAAAQAPGQLVDGIDKESVQLTKATVRFGECVARRREKDVKKIIASSVGSDEELHFMLQATRTDTDCDLSGLAGLQISKTLLLGAILEAYYHRQLKTQPLPPAQARWSARSSKPGASEQAVRQDRIADLGACIAAHNPSGAVELLKTKPMTYGERAANAALGRDVKTCAAGMGIRKITQQELRGSIATGLVNALQARRVVSAANMAGQQHA